MTIIGLKSTPCKIIVKISKIFRPNYYIDKSLFFYLLRSNYFHNI